MVGLNCGVNAYVESNSKDSIFYRNTFRFGTDIFCVVGLQKTALIRTLPFWFSPVSILPDAQPDPRPVRSGAGRMVWAGWPRLHPIGRARLLQEAAGEACRTRSGRARTRECRTPGKFQGTSVRRCGSANMSQDRGRLGTARGGGRNAAESRGHRSAGRRQTWPGRSVDIGAT